jgi:hypothetical protein
VQPTDLTDPTAELVAENIRELAGRSTYGLSAYWLSVAGSRQEYAERLGALLAPHGTPVLIVRKQRFDNANYLTEDLASLLGENRAAVLEALPRESGRSRGINIVLLGRTELAVMQTDSPVIWPEWVPNVGGREVPCLITDITRRINVPMNAHAARASEVNRALYAVEGALVRRLIEVSEREPAAHQRFFAAVRRRTDVSWPDFLGRAKRSWRNVDATESYRPTVKQGDAIVSRLWETAQSGSQSGIRDTAAGLARALWISDGTVIGEWREGMFSVLGRPHPTKESRADAFSRAIVHTVSASLQYITCAAHGGEYQRFPLQLVASVVADLYGSLRGIENCLNLLPLEPGEQRAPGAEGPE